MKRLWIALLIVALLVGMSSLHVNHLEKLSNELIAQLETAKASLIRGSRSTARESVQAVWDRWEDHAFYLHITLRHMEIDEIRTGLREAMAYLDSREDTAECLASISRLISYLELLIEAELPSIKNLL